MNPKKDWGVYKQWDTWCHMPLPEKAHEQEWVPPSSSGTSPSCHLKWRILTSCQHRALHLNQVPFCPALISRKSLPSYPSELISSQGWATIPHFLPPPKGWTHAAQLGGLHFWEKLLEQHQKRSCLGAAQATQSSSYNNHRNTRGKLNSCTEAQRHMSSSHCYGRLHSTPHSYLLPPFWCWSLHSLHRNATCFLLCFWIK